MPKKIREAVPLNTTEKLINAASGGDFESVINQMVTEINVIEREKLIQKGEGEQASQDSQ